MVDVCFFHCDFSDQLKVFVFTFLENFEINVHKIRLFFGLGKSYKPFLTFTRVHIVATS